MKGKSKQETNLNPGFDFEVSHAKSRKPLVEFLHVKPKISKENGQCGNVYVSYPAGTIGEKVPCLFCPAAQAESIGNVGNKNATIRFKCPIGDVFPTNLPSEVPRNCPRSK